MDDYIDTILSIGDDEFYRSIRYKVPLSIALIKSEQRDMFDILMKETRKTDILQQLDSDLLVVFLTHSDLSSVKFFIKKIKKITEFDYIFGEFKDMEKHKFVRGLFKQEFQTTVE